MFLVTCWAGLQWTLLLALPLPPQPWEYQLSALVSLRRCFHKSTNADPLKSGPSQNCSTCAPRPTLGAVKTAETLTQPCLCVHMQSPQLLRPDLTRLCKHPFSV